MIIPEGSVQMMEGSTELLVPLIHSEKGGPGTRIGRVFFNEQMAFNRDVTVMFFASGIGMKSALDGMASTGARGVRIAKEARTDIEITINDKDEEACSYIDSNIALNSADNCQRSKEDIRCLLTHKVFDYIDIDPFGSPTPFIPMVIQGARRKGILAITATDTAPMCGTYPKKCERRYGAHSERSPFLHETGLRILIGSLAREAAKGDRGLECILSFYADHYFRTYVRLIEGGASANKTLDGLGYIDYDARTGERTISPEKSSKHSMGPLWLGPLHNKEMLSSMKILDSLQEKERCSKYLGLWKQELDVPFYYENDEVASMMHASPPPMERVLDVLGRSGPVSRTHFSPIAFKTELPLHDVLDIYKEIV